MPTSRSIPPADDLSRLVDTERHLAERLAAARGEAQQIVEAARSAAEDAERTLERELVNSLAALRGQAEEERDRQIATLAGAAQAQVESLDGLPLKRLAALAELVLDRLLASGGEA